MTRGRDAWERLINFLQRNVYAETCTSARMEGKKLVCTFLNGSVYNMVPLAAKCDEPEELGWSSPTFEEWRSLKPRAWIGPVHYTVREHSNSEINYRIEQARQDTAARGVMPPPLRYREVRMGPGDAFRWTGVPRERNQPHVPSVVDGWHEALNRIEWARVASEGQTLVVHLAKDPSPRMMNEILRLRRLLGYQGHPDLRIEFSI